MTKKRKQNQARANNLRYDIQHNLSEGRTWESYFRHHASKSGRDIP